MAPGGRKAGAGEVVVRERCEGGLEVRTNKGERRCPRTCELSGGAVTSWQARGLQTEEKIERARRLVRVRDA